MEGGGAKVRNKDRCLLEMDVIKAIDKHTREDGTLDDDISCILEEVKSVDAKDANVPSKWIPCSKRLPEEGEIVIAYIGGTYESGGYVTACYTIYGGMDWWQNAKTGLHILCDVIAWRPLPEPYREVTDEENLESRR